MIRGFSDKTIEGSVAKTYSETKAIKVAKTFMRLHGKNSQYNIAQVDVTMFKRLVKKTWRRRGAQGVSIAPKNLQILVSPDNVSTEKLLGGSR
jgi:hypothetical protein